MAPALVLALTKLDIQRNQAMRQTSPYHLFVLEIGEFMAAAMHVPRVMMLFLGMSHKTTWTAWLKPLAPVQTGYQLSSQAIHVTSTPTRAAMRLLRIYQ